MKEFSMLPHLKNPPNWFTSASIFCGLYSITLAAEASPNDTAALYGAAIAIVFAGLFDMLDGRVARMTKTASEFGIQYDSLADVMSFGLAPAFLLYRWGLSGLGIPGLVIAFIYMTAGAMRLARFNIITRQMSNKWSLGLTITESGGTVAALVILFHRLELGAVQPLLAAALALLLSFLMVSTIPFRTFKDMRLTPRSRAVIGLILLSSALIISIYRDFAVLLVFLPSTHILSGLVEEVLFSKQRRLEEQQALMLEQVTGKEVTVGAFEDEDEEEEA